MTAAVPPASTPASSFPFDARPLVDPVDRATAQAFARELRAQGRAPAAFGGPLAIVVAVIVIIILSVFATTAVSMIVTFAAVAAGTGGFGGLLAAGAMILPLAIPFVVIVLVVVGLIRGAGGQAERWYRFDRFARANGMTYEPRFQNPGLPGMIFGRGGERASTDLVRGDRPRFVEFANYSYTTGSGKDKTTHRWGYVAVKLDVPLPNIVLDAKGNDALFGSNLPASFDPAQRLSLEGDFDRYFTLYCPKGYETDALYLFTPDIMARFIDHAAALDVEIVDDWLFLYAKRDFSTTDPATWAWLFSVVGALLDKLAQWARWRDERLMDAAPVAPVNAGVPASTALPFAPPALALRPPPGVAHGGRRLTQRVPWAAIIVIGVFVAFWLLMQFGGLAWFAGLVAP
jgi:hypothetical protein